MGGGESKGTAARKYLCKTAISGAETVTDAEEKVKATFKQWDTDGSGMISKEELVSVLMTIGTNPKDVENLLKKADVDKDGCLNYEELTACLFTAPYLKRYFEVQTDIQRRATQELQQLAAEMVKAAMECMCVEGNEKNMEKLGAKIQKVQGKMERDLKTKLVPLVRKSFKWHDKDNSSVLEADESLIFFSNYVECLGKSMAASVEMACTLTMPKDSVDSTGMGKEFKDAMDARIEEKMAEFAHDANNRVKAAFAVVDVNKDGRLQEEEVVQALTPGSEKNIQLLTALDIMVKPEDCICDARDVAMTTIFEEAPDCEQQ